MTVQNSLLYVGGNFTAADQTTVSGLAIWDGNSWSAPQGLTSLKTPISCLAVCQDTLYLADGNNSVLKVSGNALITLINGVGNDLYVKSLTTIDSNLYMGFFASYGNSYVTSCKIYEPDSQFTGADFPGGGDDYILFQNQLVSAGNVAYDYVARLWEQPMAQINAERRTICDSGSVSFSDVGPAAQSISWQFPGGNPATSTDANPTITYDAPGNYAVTLIVSNLAGADTSVMTNYISVATPLTVPTISQAGSALISSASTGNQWYDNGVAITGATGNFYTLPTIITDTSCYSLVVTDTLGCSAKSDSMCFDPTSTKVGVNEISDAISFSLYPNPTDEQFVISFTNAQSREVQISITDALGRRVYNENFSEGIGRTIHTIYTGNLAAGVYIVTLQADGKSNNQKIVIK